MLTMNGFLLVVGVVLFLCLVLAAAMQPVRPILSLAELKRRSKKSEAYVLELDRQELFAAVTVIWHSLRALLLVLYVCVTIGALGWVMGIIVALVGAVIHPGIARIKGVRKLGATIYAKCEGWLLDMAAKVERLAHALREPTAHVHEAPHKVHSREELAELVEHSTDVIGENERKLLTAALAFPEKNVADIMTPRSVIDSIKHSEFLGPLVLDELHALGHSRLPVIEDDLDHVVGVLHLRDLMSLNVRESETAEKVMEKKVFYIREDDTLEHALGAFIRTRHHLFIVINKQRETVGLLTLEDVLEQLIGRAIVDEDDIHADLRAVAERKGKANNQAPGHVDL